MSYISYNKGSNNIKINFYGHKIKNNNKKHMSTAYGIKTGTKIKMYVAYTNGEKTKPVYDTYKGSFKQYYKNVVKPDNNLK
jgi:hypothetical protein